jgi:hypothetical protein
MRQHCYEGWRIGEPAHEIVSYAAVEADLVAMGRQSYHIAGMLVDQLPRKCSRHRVPVLLVP